MIIKVGGRIFNSDEEPIIALFDVDELQRITGLNPGNDVLFSYPDHIEKQEAWDIAVQMRDDIVAARNKKMPPPLAAIPPAPPAPQAPPAPPQKEQKTPADPAPGIKGVSDNDILAMTGAPKVVKNSETGLTKASDQDILAMVGGEKPTPENTINTTDAPKENTKKSDAVLTASFDVASAEVVDGETREK